MAQLEYVHPNKSPLMCSLSLCNSCALVQTVLTLCVSVLNTFYFANRFDGYHN